MKRVQTVEEVIEKLGGAKAIAQLTRAKSPSVVPTWKYRNKFPAKTFLQINKALKARGMCAPDELWGISA